jgi:primosomal protein N''
MKAPALFHAHVVLTFCLAVPPAAFAQKAQNAPPLGGGAPPGAASAAPASADAQAKAQLLNSPRWKTTERAFNEWLSAQRIYPPDQVPQIRAQFYQMVRSMNASQLQAWLGEMEQKLAVLNSPEAQDVRDWLGHFVSAPVVLSDRELKKFDILRMSAGQARELLDEIQQRRAAMRAESQAFSATRQQEVQQSLREAQEQQQAAATAATQNRQLQSWYPSYRSQYAPRRMVIQNRQPTYWVSPWGGIGFTIP